MSKICVLDPGNSLIKAITGSEEVLSFPHLFIPLSDSQYDSVLMRAGNKGAGDDFQIINGKPYAFGETAERFGYLEKKVGAARYHQDYVGVLMAGALGKLYERGGDVFVFVSHAPKDLRYRDNLMKAVFGRWSVEIDGTTRNFNVTGVNTFDEGIGGWAEVTIEPHAQSNLFEDHVLIIDIGGKTTDFIAIAPQGEVDHAVQLSEDIGIIDVEQLFTERFLANNSAWFQDSSIGLRPDRVREAIRCGQFRGGGSTVDCQEEAEQARYQIINRILRAYQQKVGSSTRWDSIILTGGGAAVLRDSLVPLLNHRKILLAGSMDNIHLANVRGGLKLYRLFEEEL